MKPTIILVTLARSVFALGLTCSTLALAQPAPPAGQACPAGAFVTGFDAEGNILCGRLCGDQVLPAGQQCANTPQSPPPAVAAPAAPSSAPVAASAAASAVSQPAVAAVPLAISDVEPSNIVYGSREASVTVIGTGFAPGAAVVFQGERYAADVNASGTELRVTLRTRDLIIGRYALRVVNGDGSEAALRGAIAIY